MIRLLLGCLILGIATAQAQIICTTDYKPVCASYKASNGKIENKSFTNICLAQSELGISLVQALNGTCKDNKIKQVQAVCPKTFEPVCGTYQSPIPPKNTHASVLHQSFANACLMEAELFSLAHKGACTPEEEKPSIMELPTKVGANQVPEIQDAPKSVQANPPLIQTKTVSVKCEDQALDFVCATIIGKNQNLSQKTYANACWLHANKSIKIQNYTLGSCPKPVLNCDPNTAICGIDLKGKKQNFMSSCQAEEQGFAILNLGPCT